MFSRNHQWSHLGLCWEVFDYWFNLLTNNWSVHIFYVFMIQSCMFLEIYKFLLGYLICWHIIVHSNFLWALVFLLSVECLLFISDFIWVFSFFLSLVRFVNFDYFFKRQTLSFFYLFYCLFSLYFWALLFPSFY